MNKNRYFLSNFRIENNLSFIFALSKLNKDILEKFIHGVDSHE